jgi:pyruvate formate lyase activating enzyme
MKVHTAMNTNGFYHERLSDAELENIDLVLLDMKTWDPERHKRLTGMEPGATRAFAERLAARKRPIWLRFVLVPGLTDDLADVAQIARFAAGLGNVQRVDVLPFHQMGKFKYERLGIPYALKDREPPSQELVERVLGAYRDAGLVAY